jgi:hypothetical protein
MPERAVFVLRSIGRAPLRAFVKQRTQSRSGLPDRDCPAHVIYSDMNWLLPDRRCRHRRARLPTYAARERR